MGIVKCKFKTEEAAEAYKKLTDADGFSTIYKYEDGGFICITIIPELNQWLEVRKTTDAQKTVLRLFPEGGMSWDDMKRTNDEYYKNHHSERVEEIKNLRAA